MWYFAWVLGVGFAGTFSILNAIWLELRDAEPVPVRSDGRAR
jgi:cytochrome bd-I ubiquinol oxidase subunit X